MINSIICGDSKEVLKSISDNSVDLIITSPPYDKIRDYKGFDLDLYSIGEGLFRVLKNNSVAIFIMQDQTKNFRKSLTTFRTVIDYCDNIGFGLFECCIYYRYGNPGAWWNKRFRVDHEYIQIFLKGDRPSFFTKEHMKQDAIYAGTKNHGSQRLSDGSLIRNRKVNLIGEKKCCGTVMKYNPTKCEMNRLKNQHPATFPDKMVEDFIIAFSQKGETVLDPFNGSGTTSVMAKKLNRNFIGIDISEEYCNLARRRLEVEIG